MKIKHPVYQIESDRLLLRPWGESDLDEVRALIANNLEHLRRWLSWAMHEPEPEQDKLDRTRGAVDAFAAGRACSYGVFRGRGGPLIGCVALGAVYELNGRYPDPDRAGEVGYWLAENQCRAGFMSEAVATLTRAAFEAMNLRYIEIQCDPNNVPSTRIPERLGFVHAQTIRANKATPKGHPRDTMVWMLDETTYPNSRAAAAVMRVAPQGDSD